MIYGRNVPGLFERVRGQTADLDWSLKLDQSVQAPDISETRQVGERSGVTVVIWFEIPRKNALTVNAIEVATGKLFQRRVEPAKDSTRLSASATSEAAALVVRSLLVALAEGESGGVQKPVENNAVGVTEGRASPSNASAPRPSSTTVKPSEQSKPKPSTRPVAAQSEPSKENSEKVAKANSEPLPVTQPPSQEAPAESASRTIGGPTAYELAAGWQVAIDGASPFGQQGPIARFGLRFDRLELALWGLFSLPAKVSEAELTIRVRRYGLLGSIGYVLVAEPTIRVVTAAAGGILMYTRSTKVLVTNLTKMPDTSPKSLILQWDARLQWFPAFVDRVIGLEFFLALAVIPAAPIFGVQELSGRVENTSKLWVLQPAGAISLVIHGGKS